MMIDVGATFAIDALVNAVVTGIVGNQANMVVVTGARSARHAVQCFRNNLNRLDAKENQVLYRAMLTAHWQAIQQTAATYARINHIEVHANFGLWPSLLRRVLECFHLRGESVSLHLRAGLITPRSESASNALQGLIAACDQRISDLRNGPPQVTREWAAALGSMFEDLTALVAQNQDAARGPAESTWKLLEAEFPAAAICYGFHELFVSCWYGRLCVNFQILTNAPDVSLLLTGKLFAEIRERPEAPPLDSSKFVAALQDSIRTVLDGQQRIVNEVGESEKRTTDAVQKVGSEITTRLETIAGAVRASRQTHHVEITDRRIGLGNINGSVLGRDREADLLMQELYKPGPASISITAPPGFGKSALFHLAVRKTLDLNPPDGGLTGIALLNAQVKEESPGIPYLAQCLGRMAGLDQEAAAFDRYSARKLADRRRFFDFLRRMGKVWFVVDNAEAILRSSDDSAELLSLLGHWCDADHEAKLLILTRRAVHPAPRGHVRLEAVEAALMGGLPENAAVTLLRDTLKGADTDLLRRAEPLLPAITARLYGIPMAIEQFGGYMRANQDSMQLDRPFVDENALLSFNSGDPEQSLLHITREHLLLTDAPSIRLLRVVAWAGVPVPRPGMLAISKVFGAAGEPLTCLWESKLLELVEPVPGAGRSYAMHPLVREALSGLLPAASDGLGFDLRLVANALWKAGSEESESRRFAAALMLYRLSEQAFRRLVDLEQGGEPADDLADVIMRQGTALRNLGRLTEALAAHDEAIVIRRRLVDLEHGGEPANDLATAIMNRGNALRDLGRLTEAVSAYDEAIVVLRRLVVLEQRGELVYVLATAIMNRGTTLRDLGRAAEAVSAHDEAIGILRQLVDREEHVEVSNNLAIAITNRATALGDLGRLTEAVAAYDQAIVVLRRLVGLKQHGELANDLARAVMNRGNMLNGLGLLTEALAAYDEAIVILRRLIDLELRSELANELAAAIMNRGNALNGLGRLTEALAAYDEAVAIRRQLVDVERRDELANDLAFAITNRSTALRGLGRLTEALAGCDEAIAIRRRLVDLEQRGELANDLAIAITNRGFALSALGRLREALEAYDEVIAIRRRLMDLEHRGELANDLAVAILYRGDALISLSRLPEALAAYDEVLASTAQLSDVMSRRYLSVRYAVLTRKLLIRGRIRDAWRAFQTFKSLIAEPNERADLPCDSTQGYAQPHTD